jgi:hypothetical protein
MPLDRQASGAREALARDSGRVVYALDSLGNVWKLVDHSGQKWMRLTAEREG